MRKYALIFIVVLIAFFSICGYNDYRFKNLTVSYAENTESFERKVRNSAGNVGGFVRNAGQSAGNAGNSAGNVGSFAGNAGQSAESVGGFAEDTGQSAESVGGFARNAGQSAGSVGGFAGNAGYSAGNAGSLEGAGQSAGNNAENLLKSAANSAESYESAVEDLKKIAFENPKVKKAEAYILGTSAVIAIRCDAVFFRSENLSICNEIRKKAEEKGFREVYVTQDTDVFLKISEFEKAFRKNGNEAEYKKAKEKILKTVAERIYR